MPRDPALRVRDRHPRLDLVNCYGPTENSIVSTTFRLADWDGAGTSVPIGRAIAGSVCHVVDEQLRTLPPGQVGDLYLGGDRLAVGYVGDPALTEERFVPDPFSAVPGARMYRTGDRACLLENGELEFRGREDDEVKVRGVRINLAEVEALLSEDPTVLGVVAAAVGTGHERHIRAFVRSTDINTRGIRARLSERAPRHLLPDEVLLVGEFPLKASGKVDRQALLSATDSPAGPPVASPADAPGPSGDRAVLARMWQERTGTPADTGEDFFAAGGSSLDLILLIEGIRSTFGVHLDFEDVYGLSSFGELCTLVRVVGPGGSGTESGS
jgi:acyl-coenzyme A synthetase/AMP-(fatty) acid ligase/acyl carrier protein